MTEAKTPAAVVPVPATVHRELRGWRVIVGFPGLGWRTDLRADATAVQGSRTYVPVLPELEVDGRPFVHEVTTRLIQPALTPLERSRNGIRLEIARRYAALNGLNRIIRSGPADRIGIVAPGKTFLDVRQALNILGLDDAELERRGVRLLQLEMVHPLEPTVVTEFARGLREIVVVEEKRSFVEAAIKDLLYGRADAPAVTGKFASDGVPLLPSEGELDADIVASALAERFDEHGDFPTVTAWRAAQQPARNVIELPLAPRAMR